MGAGEISGGEPFKSVAFYIKIRIITLKNSYYICKSYKLYAYITSSHANQGFERNTQFSQAKIAEKITNDKVDKSS